MDPGKLGPLGTVLAVLLPLCMPGPTFAGAAQTQIRGVFLHAGDSPNANRDVKDIDNPASGDDGEQSGNQSIQGPSVFATADRTVLQLLSKARRLLQQDRYAETVRCLGTILDSPEDYFFQPDNGGPVHRSVKSEAQRLLGQMPAGGRQLYELQYGARARRMLVDAAMAGDAFQLAEVSRRFFHTQAGCEATLLLGLDHLNHARPLAAALTLKRLREASPDADQFEPMLSTTLASCWLRSAMPEKAWQTLADLKERYPKGTVTIGGRTVSLFPEEFGPTELLIQEDEVLQLLTRDDNPLGRLARVVGRPVTADSGVAEQWAMFRGNAARNASASGTQPLLSLRWRVPTTDHPWVEALMEEFRQMDQEQDECLLPALHPLAVDDVVLMRTARTLVAVDFVNGKRIWEVPVDDPFESLVNPPPDSPFRLGLQPDYGLRLRIWADATYGRISSDGQCVFSIEDLGLEAGLANIHNIFIAAGRRRSSAGLNPYNRLAAYDVRTGKLKWHIGGASEESPLAQAGAFFLGPPLPLLDQLFVLAEVKGEIRLMALEAKTGDLLWSQQLAQVDRDILNDPLRRLAGVSPSYADGILVCPTSHRAIVALELATRSLLWGYTYSPQDQRFRQQVLFFGMPSVPSPGLDGRWIDSSVMLADGRVLVTPLDSDHLHCLELIDGKPLWEEARQDDLYVACVHHGKVILVGLHHVRALNLDDGQPAWENRTVAFPSGSTPTGLGFLSGDLYHVPLSSGEVMAVDLDAGRSVCVSKSLRGNMPGNLICYKDRVISQRAGAVEAFYQLDALEKLVDQRLAADEHDAEALALRGEIRWHDGKLQAAIEDLRRSLELAPNPNTRQLLRDAFFEGLREQFATHRNHVDEIKRLIDEPRQQATFLRLMAVGHQNAGQFLAALESYLELIALDRDHRDMEPVEKSLTTRRDRWIQIQLAALHQAASSEARAEIDRVVRTRFVAALAEETPEALELFLQYFGGHPLADEARRELVHKLKTADRLLEAELLLRREERSEDPQRAAAAVAELAAMLRHAGRWKDAAAYYARLAGKFADVACQPVAVEGYGIRTYPPPHGGADSPSESAGKTGKQMVDALPADDPVRRQLQQSSPWPIGSVEVEKGSRELTPLPTYTVSVIQYHGSPGAFFSELAVELHQNPPMLVCRDGWGNRQWQLSIAELPRHGPFSINRGLMQAAAHGHLLLVWMGGKILAVDTLGPAGNGKPRILWTRDLDESGEQMRADAKTRILMANLAVGLQQLQLARYAHTPIDGPEVISEQMLCFMRFRNCIAVDPLTGETLWVRGDLQPGSTVFGDQQYVFIVPPEKTTVEVLRAFDGKLVAKRELPPQGLATIGRRILVWRNAGNHGVLEVIDAWDHSKVWASRKFAADAKLELVDMEAVAVFEPAGRFALLDLADGRTIIDAKVLPEPSLSKISVLRSSEQYILVAQGANGDNRNSVRRTYPIHGTRSERIAQARVYAFNRQGEKLWPAPVTVEDQYLLLHQPSRLPVLTFACRVQRRVNQRTRSSTSILCIDKRNGRVIDGGWEFPNMTNSLRLVGDPEQKTVQVQLQRQTVTMKFTDSPLRPEPEADRDSTARAPENAKTTAHAVWNAIRSATIGRAWGWAEPARALPSAGPLDVPSDEQATKPASRPDQRAPTNGRSVPGRQ